MCRLPVRLGEQDTGAVDDLVGRGLPACFLTPLIVLVGDFSRIWSTGS